jgi:ribonucleoside-triphosphate reductase
MSDRESIEARIAELKGQLSRVEGTPTEVYSRIVGYYRSVRNWNAGKREEYGQRLVYEMPARGDAPAETAKPVGLALHGETNLRDSSRVRDGVLVFTREACPNCPPVADYVAASGMRAVFVDVDRAEGLALARDFGVMATPTVLGLDGEGNEAFRAFDVVGLRSRVEAR